MQAYTLAIPADVARAAAASRCSDGAAAHGHLAPTAVLGAADDRELGVMVDRVEIRRAP